MDLLVSTHYSIIEVWRHGAKNSYTHLCRYTNYYCCVLVMPQNEYGILVITQDWGAAEVWVLSPTKTDKGIGVKHV